MNPRTHLVAADGHITKPPCLGKQVGGDIVPLQMQTSLYSMQRYLQAPVSDELLICIEVFIVIQADDVESIGFSLLRNPLKAV